MNANTTLDESLKQAALLLAAQQVPEIMDEVERLTRAVPELDLAGALEVLAAIGQHANRFEEATK